MVKIFANRRQAGLKLAQTLSDFARCPDCVVLAIPRGGVVVAAEIARQLKLPLDLVITKKIGAPFNPELAIGSVDSNGKISLDETLIARLNIPSAYIHRAAKQVLAQIKNQLAKYRARIDYPDLTQKTVILVDDGIATGQTVIAAIGFLKSLPVRRLVIATPVIAPATLANLKQSADEIRYVRCEHRFLAVGQFYQDFSPVSDDEVITIMNSFITN
ncbi:MAG: phosphoribosyltransferase [Firmicutes bacterium]|nr:phosphoribosyltransferase [Bacillota bacterium]